MSVSAPNARKLLGIRSSVRASEMRWRHHENTPNEFLLFYGQVFMKDDDGNVIKHSISA